LVSRKISLFHQDSFKAKKMKKLYKKLGFLFALILIGQMATSQSKQAQFIAATNSFKNLKYSLAITQLKPIVDKDTTNIAAMAMLADSYRFTKQYPEALNYYEKLVLKSNPKADWVLRYAESLAIDKAYEKSELWYRKYLSMVPSDRRAASFSKADLGEIGKVSSWDVKYLNINTPASEYSPMLYKNGLVFTSNKYYSKPVKHVFAWNNTPFSDLYYVQDLNNIQEKTTKSDASNTTVKNKQGKFNDDNTAITSNDTKAIGIFDKKVYTSVTVNNSNEITPISGNINTKFHEGPSAFLPEGGIIFTRNNYYKSSKGTSKDGKVKLKMFIAKGEGLKEIIPFPYNNDNYSVGHPTVSKDGKVLIFASDMNNGSGGVDLYYSVRINEKQDWGRPVNLGRKVNTEGDEEFPFLDDNDVLYFSSNGLAGLGGLDVFSVQLKDLQPVGVPKNLGAPFNSSFDDFGVAKTGKLTGYLSSNRLGNDDIYSFVQKQFGIILKGVVTDATTGLPLKNAKVILRNGDDEEILELDDKGQFTKPLLKDIGYELKAGLTNYLPERRYVGTDGITKDTIIYVPIKLKGVNDIQKFVINNCDSLKKVFFVDNIYYDLDKYFIRADAEPNLKKLIALMTKYPDIKVVTRSHCDSRASESYNRILSLRRGESAKAYLTKNGVDQNRIVDPGRISVQYYGKSKLVNGCKDGVPCSEAEQQMNRRTEFEIIYNGINLALIDCN
jgi:outer membrane protein OmpA-like peptidoglycan-associated protein/tetratricopeptide (TPR) repeat protein